MSAVNAFDLNSGHALRLSFCNADSCMRAESRIIHVRSVTRLLLLNVSGIRALIRLGIIVT